MDPAQHPSAATAQEWRRNQNSKRNRSMGSRVLGPIGTGAVPRQQPLNGMLNPSAPLGDVNGISPTPAPFDPGLPPTVHTPSRAIPRIP